MERYSYWGRDGIERFGLRLTKEELAERVRKERARESRETPEEMIRALRGVFCKGRYRSWVPDGPGRRAGGA